MPTRAEQKQVLMSGSATAQQTLLALASALESSASSCCTAGSIRNMTLTH